MTEQATKTVDTLMKDIILPSLKELMIANDANELQLKNLSGATVLFGRDSQLDSLGLVNLIVRVEEAYTEKYDTNISLATESAMSRANSPFRTAQTLAEYIFEIQSK